MKMKRKYDEPLKILIIPVTGCYPYIQAQIAAQTAFEQYFLDSNVHAQSSLKWDLLQALVVLLWALYM